MRKKKLSMRLLSAMLAVGMVVSGSFGNVATITASAAEIVEAESECQTDDLMQDGTEDDLDSTDDLEAEEKEVKDASNEADEESVEDEVINEEEKEVIQTSVNEDLNDALDENAGQDTSESTEDKKEEDKKEEKTPFENPYESTSFQSLLKKEMLTCDSDKVEIDSTSRDDGILVTAKADKLKKANFAVTTPVNFGEKRVDRIMIDAVAKRATKTYLKMYIDDQKDPIATFRLPMQKQEDSWKQKKKCSIDVSDLNLTGTHSIRFQLVDETTADDKKTTVLLRSMQFVQYSIPTINLNIDESYANIGDMHNDSEHETECYGDVSISVPNGYTSEFDKAGTYQGGTYKLDYIRGRGNSTWTADKKPYKIKLDKATDLFGMGSNKHWVLLANHFDNSLVRNRMTYEMGRDLGMEFTPECVSVDVYMNNEYIGNYLLSEQIRVGESRVDIFDMEKEYEKKEMTADSDVTGGYLLGMAPYGDEKGYGFVTDMGNSFYVESPESDYGTPLGERMDIDFWGEEVQKPQTKPEKDNSKYAAANAYITDYVQQVEDAIYGKGFKNKDGVSYADLMDVDSAVAYFWMQEFSHNGDAYYTTSTYLYKDKDKVLDDGTVKKGKLCWGPLWDFDYVAWASYDYSDYDADESSYANWEISNQWFVRLLEDPAFVAKVQAYWNEKLKPELEKVVADDGMLAKYEKELTASANMNFERWGYTDFDYWGENSISVDEREYSFEINRLRNWINHRMDWVDRNIDTFSTKTLKVRFMVDDQEVMSTEGNLNREFSEFPEDPVAKEKGSVFGGWYYDYSYIDSESGEVRIEPMRVTPFSYLDDSMIQNSNTVIFYAKWIDESEVVPIKQVHFERQNYCLFYDDMDSQPYPMEFYLNWTYAPYEATNTKLTWASSNEAVACVDEYGNVTAVGSGDATITVTTAEGKSFSTNVHVIGISEINKNYEEYTLQDFELTETDLSMNVDDVMGIQINTVPSDVLCNYEEGFQWFSTNSEVATVDCGLVIANAPGEAIIVAEGMVWGAPVFKICKVTVNGATNGNKPHTTTKPVTKPVTKPATTEASNTTNQTKVGSTFVKSNLKYAVTKVDKAFEVQVTGMKKDKSSVKIPGTVKYNGKTYKVTSVKAKAFANNKKITKITIGSNVTSIGAKAFYNCKKCKSVKIKSTKIKSIGKKAFAKLPKKVNISMDEKNYKSYKGSFKGYKNIIVTKVSK